MGTFLFTDPLFTIWSALVEERTGIHYAPADRALFASKLEARAVEAGFDSLMDYYYFIRYDPASKAELERLIDALVVNETYFFREAGQLEALADEILRPICESGRRARVWCAACASGEEPLTLAMILDRRGLLDNVDIVASDIGLKILARAKAGGYGGRSLRALPPGVMGRWIEMDDGRARVSPRIHDRIDWRRVNLLDDAAIAALGTFDAILCRNVLIYFSDDTVIHVVTSLLGALTESAPLLVGVSESLLRFGTLVTCEERAGSFFHRRTRP